MGDTQESITVSQTNEGDWRALVEEAAKSSPIAKELSLATVTPQGPRNRTVTFQGFSPSGLIQIATDPSSKKVEELKENGNVEIAWFIASAGCQFRIRGHVTVIDDKFAQCKLNHVPVNAPELQAWYWEDRKKEILEALPPARRHPIVMLALEPHYVQQLDLLTAAYSEWTEVENEFERSLL